MLFESPVCHIYYRAAIRCIEIKEAGMKLWSGLLLSGGTVSAGSILAAQCFGSASCDITMAFFAVGMILIGYGLLFGKTGEDEE